MMTPAVGRAAKGGIKAAHDSQGAVAMTQVVGRATKAGIKTAGAAQGSSVQEIAGGSRQHRTRTK